jgi:hypothetical protein
MPGREVPMADLPFRPARELAALIRKKKVGCVELLDTYRRGWRSTIRGSTPSS